MHTNQLVSPALKGWTVLVQGLQEIAVSCAMRWPIFFLNYCPVLLEYIQLGKASRNTQNNMVMLGNGVPILLTQKIVHGLLGSMSIMPGTHIYFLERLSKQTFQPTCLNFVVKEP